MQDPEAFEINKKCETLIGAEIKINSNIKLKNKSTWCFKLSNKNIVGDSLEEIIFPYLKKYFKHFKCGPKQKSPDFFNGDEFEYEMKTYTNKPSFDLGSFTGFLKQLTARGGVERKLFKTKYLIFQYHHNKEDVIVIDDFVFASLHEILNYKGKYPISLQVCDQVWKSIRPCSIAHRNRQEKSRYTFIGQFCEAIRVCPNFIENRREKIENIEQQFETLVGTTNTTKKKRKRNDTEDEEEVDVDIKRTKI